MDEISSASTVEGMSSAIRSEHTRVYILDTMVISELMTAEKPWLREWLSNMEEASLFTTAITYAEILFGIAQMPKGKKQTKLSEMTHILFNREFSGRILPFDIEAAEHFAVLAITSKRNGLTPGLADLQIASIALARGATVVTRNVKHFKFKDVETLNPWGSQE